MAMTLDELTYARLMAMDAIVGKYHTDCTGPRASIPTVANLPEAAQQQERKKAAARRASWRGVFRTTVLILSWISSMTPFRFGS